VGGQVRLQELPGDLEGVARLVGVEDVWRALILVVVLIILVVFVVLFLLRFLRGCGFGLLVSLPAALLLRVVLDGRFLRRLGHATPGITHAPAEPIPPVFSMDLRRV
jgi:hypothetical protein